MKKGHQINLSTPIHQERIAAIYALLQTRIMTQLEISDEVKIPKSLVCRYLSHLIDDEKAKWQWDARRRSVGQPQKLFTAIHNRFAVSCERHIAKEMARKPKDFVIKPDPYALPRGFFA